MIGAKSWLGWHVFVEFYRRLIIFDRCGFFRDEEYRFELCDLSFLYLVIEIGSGYFGSNIIPRVPSTFYQTVES